MCTSPGKIIKIASQIYTNLLKICNFSFSSSGKWKNFFRKFIFGRDIANFVYVRKLGKPLNTLRQMKFWRRLVREMALKFVNSFSLNDNLCLAMDFGILGASFEKKNLFVIQQMSCRVEAHREPKRALIFLQWNRRILGKFFGGKFAIQSKIIFLSMLQKSIQFIKCVFHLFSVFFLIIILYGIFKWIQTVWCYFK